MGSKRRSIVNKDEDHGGVIEAAEVRIQEFKAGSFQNAFKTEFVGSGEKKARLPGLRFDARFLIANYGPN